MRLRLLLCMQLHFVCFLPSSLVFDLNLTHDSNIHRCILALPQKLRRLVISIVIIQHVYFLIIIVDTAYPYR